MHPDYANGWKWGIKDGRDGMEMAAYPLDTPFGQGYREGYETGRSYVNVTRPREMF